MNLVVHEGIITLEDILEELVGEIQDEEDEEEKIVDKVGENVFWVQATQPLEEINECLPKQLPEDGRIQYFSRIYPVINYKISQKKIKNLI